MKRKIQNTDRLLAVAQKNNITLKNIYRFELSGRQVKAVFSDNLKAPTIEDVLVKIATGRIG